MVSKIYGPQVPKPSQVSNIGASISAPQSKPVAGVKSEFQRILQQKTSSVEFSAHATKRLAQRGIELTEQDVSRLSSAMDMADNKGSKESLVLLNGQAFVVSVPNRTVITAIDMESMKENVITNIDSAVIA
ncbi:MAG TPA: TIGR02530 family flagellar biosynthesis protein [bacterium]|nr:TIGR02530 family flagellar biosynthesis protein [bacterium]